jgi:hypothetical protein
MARKKTTETTAAPAEVVAPEARVPHGELITTTLRITRPQLLALRRAALTRAEASGGRPDMSAIVRERLDRWIAQGAK